MIYQEHSEETLNKATGLLKTGEQNKLIGPLAGERYRIDFLRWIHWSIDYASFAGLKAYGCCHLTWKKA